VAVAVAIIARRRDQPLDLLAGQVFAGAAFGVRPPSRRLAPHNWTEKVLGVTSARRGPQLNRRANLCSATD
jgi:hypothetical protein